jgi:hypothetical protein
MLAGASATALCATGLASLGRGSWPGRSGDVLFVVASTVLALLLSPVAAYAARPVRLCRRLGQPSVSSIVKAALAIGMGVGGAGGALLGTVAGMLTNPMTAVAALIEGGILGAVNGGVAALLIAAVVVSPRLRVLR